MTEGYKRLRGITGGNKKDYRGLQGVKRVTGCYIGLQWVTESYNWLQGVTKGYRGVTSD